MYGRSLAIRPGHKVARGLKPEQLKTESAAWSSPKQAHDRLQRLKDSEKKRFWLPKGYQNGPQNRAVPSEFGKKQHQHVDRGLDWFLTDFWALLAGSGRHFGSILTPQIDFSTVFDVNFGLSCFVPSCLVLSFHVRSGLDLSCLALPCLVSSL